MLRKIATAIISLVVVITFSYDRARAESAVFLAPSNLSNETAVAISTMGDNAGVTIGNSESLQLLFDQPFQVTRQDRVSIFTLPPVGGGTARGEIRVGRLIDGNLEIVGTRNFRSQNSVTLNGLLRRNCADIGGCNFIEIITTRTRRGAEGVQVDYVQINGEVVTVVAPTPEPESWVLMIISFFAIACRVKTIRRKTGAFPIQKSEKKSLLSTGQLLEFIQRLFSHSAYHKPCQMAP